MYVCVLWSCGNLFRKTVWELKDNTFLGTGFCLNGWVVINLVKKIPDLLKENSRQCIQKRSPKSPTLIQLHPGHNSTPCFYTSQFITYNSYLHLKCTIPDPFWYFVICSDFLQKVFVPCPVQDLAGIPPSAVHICVFSTRTFSSLSSAESYQWSRHAAVTKDKIVR